MSRRQPNPRIVLAAFALSLVLAWTTMRSATDTPPPPPTPAERDRSPSKPRATPIAAPTSSDRITNAPNNVASKHSPTSSEEPQAPEVDDEPALALPPADRHGIDQQILENISDIRDCYMAALSEFPDLEGGFKLRFVIEDIEGLGEVTEVAVQDIRGEHDWPLTDQEEPDDDGPRELVDAPMEDCVMDYIESMTFQPPADGPVVVVYPMMFAPG